MDLAFEDAELVAEGKNLDLECGFGLSAEDKEIEQRADDGVKQAQDHGRGSWRLGRSECWRCRCRGDHRGRSTFLNSTRAFEVMVVNARHVKAVPGRKTDVRDAEWLADLVRHGLLRPSFIPDREQRELRDLVYYRRTLIQGKSRLVTRIQELLEAPNIKLGDVATNVMGLSAGRCSRSWPQGTPTPKPLLGDSIDARARTFN
jgi:hypothetical protein